MKRNILVLVVVLIALTAAATYFARSNHEKSALIEAKTTELIKPTNAKDLLKEVKKLNAKVTLVNFWASWCEPCKQEFPFILQLRKELADKGLQVIFVSLDEQRDLDEAQSFLASQHVDFQTYYKGDQPLQMVSEILPQWQGAIPTSVLLNSTGKVVDAWEGDATLAEFKEHVGRQLEAQ